MMIMNGWHDHIEQCGRLAIVCRGEILSNPHRMVLIVGDKGVMGIIPDTVTHDS